MDPGADTGMRISFPRVVSCGGIARSDNPARHRGAASPGFHVGNERYCSLTSGVHYVCWIFVLQDIALLL